MAYVTFPETPLTEEQLEGLQILRDYAAAGNPRPTRAENPDLAAYLSIYSDYISRFAPAFDDVLLAIRFYANEPNFLLRGHTSKLGSLARTLEQAGDPRYPVVRLWVARAAVLFAALSETEDYDPSSTLDLLFRTTSYTFDDVFDQVCMDRVTDSQREAIYAAWRDYIENIMVYLDGEQIASRTGSLAELKAGRTMLPIYLFADKLGADILWNGEDRTVTLTRAGTEIILTIGSKTAIVNGEPFEMDVAPYIKEDRTLLPASYVSLFFGQKVQWDPDNRVVYISENKEAAGNSNLEAWALAMSAVQACTGSRYEPDIFGWESRNYETVLVGTPMSQMCRNSLLNGWGITGRDDLIATVLSMTYMGHDLNFLYDAALIDSMSPSEYRQLVDEATGVDAYMWPYTKQLSEKWGDRGILCWDLFRMSALVQWGYMAGYLTYPEALVLLEPAATILQENFTSWDEAYENYVDGYNWWARNDVLDTDVWDTERGVTYQELKAEYGETLFDDDLFREGVIPVPDLSLDDILVGSAE